MTNRKRQYRELDEILDFITNENADSNDEDLIDDDSESANNHEPSNTGAVVNKNL